MSNRARQIGLVYGVAAFGLWGVVPLYFLALKGVPAEQILAHRIVWCLLLLLAILLMQRRGGEVLRCLRPGRLRWLLLTGSVLITLNWFTFVYGVSEKQLIQTSLGYFISPLFNVLLGLVVFGERLRPAMWLGLIIAAVGMIYQIVQVGELPWIALSLAGTFALYGLVRKVAVVDSMVGLTIETLFMAPVAAAFLAWWWSQQTLVFGSTPRRDVLVALSGVVTAIPLICFAQAARRLPMTTLGFLQYLSPTGQLLIGLFVIGEQFTLPQQIGFGCTWVGLAIISVDGLYAARGRAAAARRTSLEMEAQAAGADR